MSVELALLNAVIARRDFSLLVRQGLADDDAWREQSEAYRFIRKHVDEYGETPSVESVIRACATFEATDVVESPETLCAKLHERNVKLGVRSMLELAAKKYADTDGYNILTLVEHEASKIRLKVNATKGAGAVNLTHSTNERKAELERKMSGDGGVNIPLFWNVINDAIGKFTYGDYVDIEAALKIGKTWVGFVAGVTSNFAGFKVLHELAEANKDEAKARYDTIALGVSNRGVYMGRMSEEEKDEYFRKLDELAARNLPDYIIKTADDWPNGLTIEQLEADIDMYDPDVVIIDQFNLMVHGGSEPRNYAETSRRLRQLFARKRVLGVVLTQANGQYVKMIDKQSEDLEDGAIRELRPPRKGDYSETIAVRQDCTHMIALDAILFTDEATKKQRGKALVIVEISRTGGAGTEVSLEWCPNDGIIRPRTPTDVF